MCYFLPMMHSFLYSRALWRNNTRFGQPQDHLRQDQERRRHGVPLGGDDDRHEPAFMDVAFWYSCICLPSYAFSMLHLLHLVQGAFVCIRMHPAATTNATSLTANDLDGAKVSQGARRGGGGGGPGCKKTTLYTPPHIVPRSCRRDRVRLCYRD